MNQRTAKADLISPAPARDSRRRLPRFTARRVKMLFVGVLMTGSVLPIGSQVAEAYDAWNCGTVTHSYPVAAGSASLSSTVYG